MKHTNLVLYLFIALPLLAFQRNHARNVEVVDSLSKKAWKTLYENPEEASKLADYLMSLSDSLKYPNGIADGLTLLGIIEHRENNWQSARTHYQGALKIWKKLDMPEDMAIVHNQLGILCESFGDYDMAMEHFFQAEKHLQGTGNFFEIGRTNLNFANLYKLLNDNTFAKKKYSEALGNFEKAGEPYEVAKTNYNLSDLFRREGQYQKAINKLQEALGVFEALKDTIEMAKGNNVLGAINNDWGRDEEAESFYKRSIALAHQIEDELLLFDAYLNLSLTKYNQGEYLAALQFIEKAEAFLGNSGGLADQKNLAEQKADIYEGLKRFEEAHHFRNEVVSLSDSLYDQSVAEAKEKYKVLEENLKRLEAEKLNEQQANKLQLFTGLLVIATLLILILAGGFFFYRQKQRAGLLILRHQAKMHQKEIENMISDLQLASIRARRDGEREAKKEIQKVLHDTVGSQLAAARWLHEENIELFKKEALKVEQLEAILNMLNKGYEELKGVVNELEKEENRRFEELETFYDYLSQGRRIKVNFIKHGLDQELDKEVEEEIYSIIVELTTNVLKHAHAKVLNVQINRLGQELNILVEDDGIGFDKDKTKRGNGLRNIEQRVAGLNGNLIIDSNIMTGTTVNIVIPINRDS